MATAQEDHRRDLANCATALGNRALQLNESAIASIFYTIAGSIGSNLDLELAKTTSEFSLYVLLYNKINKTLDEQQNNSGSVAE
jgi:hypothetical protein